jgi:hypothetical protein
MAPKQAGVAILIFDRAYFKQKLEETKNHIDKGNNPSGGCNNCKDKCTKHQYT